MAKKKSLKYKDGVIITYQQDSFDGDKFTPKISYNSFWNHFSADFGSHTDYYRDLENARNDMYKADFKVVKVNQKVGSVKDDNYYDTPIGKAQRELERNFDELLDNFEGVLKGLIK